MTTHYRRPQREPYVDEVSICGMYLTPGVWRCEYASMTTCEACLEALARQNQLDYIAAPQIPWDRWIRQDPRR